MPFIGDMINLGANLSEPVWAQDRAEKLASVGRELWAQGKPWRPLMPKHEFDILMKYPESRAILKRVVNLFLNKKTVTVKPLDHVRRDVNIPRASYHDLKSLCVYDLQVLRDFLIQRKSQVLFGLLWPEATLLECNKLLRIRLYNEAWDAKGK